MREEGFTLVEILIAVTISAIIMTVTFIFFQQSLSTWERSGANSDWQQHWRVLESDLQRHLNNIFLSPLYQDNLFIGEEHSLEFLTVEDKQLKRISYFFDPYQGLLKREISSIDKEESQQLLFFNNLEIEGVNFYFYDPKDDYWKGYWSYEEEERLPTAIKVQITIKKVELPPIVIALYLGREYQG
ncbi:general secretion pathway protein J [Orenia metallireducens]|uniref:General secretion pathway protein J n=1 Tax=Orenia metallireducens TaxID=1413210 RepID=A0A285GI13_9FIRM|nr:prepilin-type N-terminal cleavage/methylation domain-containing protein [Orenia metallireducens]PRX30486.1 general secretion pathway protein J [Orenia metallireducens]SNY22824.1 general secretion pathway protein J [Orenia metallireducens]